MKERYFYYEPWQEKYYCKKCDKNHRTTKSMIGRRHRCFAVYPFGNPNTVVSFIEEVGNNG